MGVRIGLLFLVSDEAGFVCWGVLVSGGGKGLCPGGLVSEGVRVCVRGY